MNCEYKDICSNKCGDLLKKTCKSYRAFFLRDLVASLPVPHPSRVQIETASTVSVGCYYEKSIPKLQAVLLASVQSHIRKVKVYNYNTAIQAAFEETLPQESVIYIDAAPNYSDITKGMQTIESFVDALVEAKKLVFLHVKSGYSNKNYKLC